MKSFIFILTIAAFFVVAFAKETPKTTTTKVASSTAAPGTVPPQSTTEDSSSDSSDDNDVTKSPWRYFVVAIEETITGIYVVLYQTFVMLCNLIPGVTCPRGIDG